MPRITPPSKLSGGQSVHVTSENGINYFGLVRISDIIDGYLFPTTNIAVSIAYNIDNKVDNGKPATGRVVAKYANPDVTVVLDAVYNAAASSTTTCYETTNGNYSISTNNGRGANCALAFMFQ